MTNVSIPGGDPRQDGQNFSCGPFCMRDFSYLSLFLCRDQDGSKKPADICQVGAGSPAQKEPKPSPVAVPPAKQDSGMKDKSFAFILLIREGTGIVLQGCVGGECAFAFRDLCSLHLLQPCGAFILCLWWVASHPSPGRETQYP